MRMTLTGLDQNANYIVQLRTKRDGDLSLWSRSFGLSTIKDNVAPSPVTNLAGGMNEGNLSLSWSAPKTSSDGSDLNDLKDYVVTIGPVPDDPEWPLHVIYAEGTRAEFTKELNAAAFGRYRSNLRITVQARDIVDNLSIPVSLVIAKTRPNPVSNLVWGPKDTSFAASWSAPIENTDGTPLTDLAGYDVTVSNGLTSVTKRVLSTTFNFSIEENKSAFGGASLTPVPSGILTIEVRAVDSVGQQSAPATATAQNAAPAKVTGVKVSKMVNAVRVEWDSSNKADSVAYYEVWVAPNSSAVGSLSSKTISNFYIHDSVAYDSDHYFYVYAVDEFGLRSLRSDYGPDQPIRPDSPFSVDTTPPAPVASISAAPYAGGSSPAGLLVSWGRVPDAAGYHISYSLNVNPPVWEYTDIPDNSPASPQAVLSPLVAESAYLVRVRSYDQFVNTSVWSQTIGVTPASTAKFTLTDISTDIRVITGGVLRSQNYDETTGAGWRLMPSALDIQSGRVNAAVISAGQLRSSLLSATTSAEPGQPVWSLDTEGDAVFRNLRVRGAVVVGSPELDGSRVAITSYNWGQPTGNMWSIRGNGDFSMIGRTANANTRVQIGQAGIFAFDEANTNTVGIWSDGSFLLKSKSNGMVFDTFGLRLFNTAGVATVTLTSATGDAIFNGRVTSTTGAIGGWTLSATGLTNGTVSLRSDLSEIRVGTLANTVGMRAGQGFWAGAQDAFSVPAPPFKVDPTGSLTANKGLIGGFAISANDGLVSTGGGITTVGMKPSQGIWTGSTVFGTAPTRMTNDGSFFSSKATITGNITAEVFQSIGSSVDNNYIQIGGVGVYDPADEIRMYLGATVSAIRNPSNDPGAIWLTADGNADGRPGGYVLQWSGQGLNLNTSPIRGVQNVFSAASTSTYWNLGLNRMNFVTGAGGGNLWTWDHTDSSHGSLRYGGATAGGGATLKFVQNRAAIQVRDYFDNGWGTLEGVITNTSSSQYKGDIIDWDGQALPLLRPVKVKKWRRITGDRPDGTPILTPYHTIGPILEEMPEEARPNGSTDAYDVGAVIGLLWKGVQELADKVDSLEAKIDNAPGV